MVMASEKEGHPMSGKRNLTVRTVNSVQDCTNSLLRHTLAGFVLHRFIRMRHVPRKSQTSHSCGM